MRKLAEPHLRRASSSNNSGPSNARATLRATSLWRAYALALFVTGGLCFLVGCWSQSSSASKGPSADAVAESRARAVESIGDRYWYDPSTKTYRPPKVSADLDHPLRQNGAAAGSKPPAAPWRPFGSGLRMPSGKIFAYAAFVILGLALLAVAVVLAAVSLGGWRPLRKNVERFKAVEIDPARVSDLPFEAQAEMHDPLVYAKHLLGLGKYNEAILFLYGYMLLALDRAGKIVLHRGKTNRMYLHELANERQLRSHLVPAMLGFEDVFFGRHDMQPERFQKIWAQLDEFHRALAPAIAEIAAADRMSSP